MEPEWRSTTLGKFVRLQRGHDLTAANQRPGPYPVMGSAGQNGTHDEFIAHGPGVVIGRSGASIGRVHFTQHDYWPHNTCLYVTDFLGNDPKFAFYFLSTLDLANYNSGSVQPSLNRNYVYAKTLRIPGVNEQREIAGFLGALDDRIDNLRATNATLEAIAQALFKSWFVDFDPVHAKAEGRAPAGMDAATAALFPSAFEDSELSPIPKGWHSYTFGDIALQHKGTVNPGALPSDTFHHYSLPAFDAGQLPALEQGEAIKSNKTPVPDGSVLVSKLNPHIPRIWFVGKAGSNAVCSTEFLVWTPKRGASEAVVYCAATSHGFNAAMRQLVTGTSNSHQRVRPAALASIHAAVASDFAMKAFGRLVAPLLARVEHNRQAAATLADLRDTLLPRLISGKLRLPDVEQFAEEVA